MARGTGDAADVLRRVTEESFDIVAILGPDGVFTYCNPAAERCLGYDFVSLKVPAFSLVHESDKAEVRRVLKQLRVPGGQASVECRLAHADGSWRDVLAVGVNLDHDPEIGGILFHALDITDQRAAERELAHVSTHDPLTGLGNYELFVHSIRRAHGRYARRGEAYAVLVLDIDEFRTINELHGHAVGDAVLVALAERVVSTLRTYDTVVRTATSVARLGGDEFLVLCEEVDEAAATVIANRLREAVVGTPLDADGVGVALTVSTGIAVVTPGSDWEAVLLEAQRSVRVAKEHGSGGVVCGSTLLRADADAQRTEARRLRQGIHSGELVVHYQPKIEIESCRLIGVEALVRWEHPERGLLPPGSFVPLAESSGLIRELGACVLREACRQRSEWEAQRPATTPLTVSVNVSAEQFTSDLPALVSDVLDEASLDPSALTIELTESVLMTDVASAVATATELAALGVAISVDDFGTGYSSLAYLKRFPISELKIDRSFIAGLGHDPEDTAICAAIVAMAHALGLSVTAEGVETPVHLDHVTRLGCEVVQGYLLGRPLPAREIEAYVISGRLPARVEPNGGDSSSVQAVLIVDDAADVRQLAQVSLATAGYTVLEADNGAEALQIASRAAPSCVIVDVNMPGMTGFEVCRALRGDPKTSSMTIVMLTSADTAEDKIAAYIAGADDYITKPFAPRDLVSRVRHAMTRHLPPAE